MNHFSSLRIIPFEYFNGIENMALDLLYAEQVSQTKIPVLRFYGWSPFCLSLGRHQDIKSVDLNRIFKDGIDIVRRPTGGSAILHSDELTYSFIIPKTDLSHHEMYEILHILLARVLINTGFDVELNSTKEGGQYLNHDNSTFACFNRAAKSEIQYKGKKVVGSAQKVYKNSILQHGSIIIGDSHEQIINYLETDISEKEDQRDLLRNNSTNLEKIVERNINKNEIAANLTDAFNIEHNMTIHYKYPTKFEKKEAQKFNKQVIVSNNRGR